MAKRRRRKPRIKKTRVAPRPVNATRSARVRFRLPSPRSPLRKDDRRMFSPSSPSFRLVHGPAATVGPSSRQQAPGPRPGAFTRERVAFSSPRRVMVCVRRSERRQVLFAKGRTKGRIKKPRWTETSYTACRKG